MAPSPDEPRRPAPAAGSRRRGLAGTLALAAGMAWRPARAVPRRIEISAGAGSFTFVDAAGLADRPLTVHTYLPPGLAAREAPIVFVMHGHGKNASGYRDVWSEPARRHGFLAIVPHFDAIRWPHGDYSLGRVLAPDGRAREPSQWSFSVVEHLFDAIRHDTGHAADRYSIYGHSEGGQFVHRLLLFLPSARFARAAVANPGWYTMPTRDVDYPYGLGRTPVDDASLRTSLGRDVVLLLGEADTGTDDADLRRTPSAIAQGRNRFERGHAFFGQAEAAARRLRCPFGWRLKTVPGAWHSNAKMADASARALMAR